MGEYFSEVHVHRPIFSSEFRTVEHCLVIQHFIFKKNTKEENYPQKKRVSKYYGLLIFWDPTMCIIYTVYIANTL